MLEASGYRLPGETARRIACDAEAVDRADGGETKLDNLALTCPRHHRAPHEGGYRVERTEEGEPRCYRPDGRLLPEAPSLPPVPSDIEWGAGFDAETTTPDWHGERVDLDWAISVMWRPPVRGDGQWARQGSNLGPTDYESAALTN